MREDLTTDSPAFFVDKKYRRKGMAGVALVSAITGVIQAL